MKKVAVIGASVGGLVAASVLSEYGFYVEIIEAASSIGGLYQKVPTPFGIQELGMHVLYGSDEEARHLRKIYGNDYFFDKTGPSVDLGGAYNFGKVFLNSMYPDIRQSPVRASVLEHVLGIRRDFNSLNPTNALEAITARFGEEGAQCVVRPIIEKLWHNDARVLSPESIHVFFDLRRMVVCDREEAAELKKDSACDQLIANPEQRLPSGSVFGGRKGLFINRNGPEVAHDELIKNLEANRINARLNKRLTFNDQKLIAEDQAMMDEFDAIIVTSPIIQFSDVDRSQVDSVTISLFYCRLDQSIEQTCPVYYILGHDPKLKASRIVNYDAYKTAANENERRVVAIEVVHPAGACPSESEMATEIGMVFPDRKVESIFKFSKSLPLPSPTLNNGKLFDRHTANIREHLAGKEIYFTGMRTDKGSFFSHHTMGAAYNAALDCQQRLS